MNLELIQESIPLLLKGTKTTLLLWLCSSFFSVILGIIIGIFRCRKLRIWGISGLLDIVTFVLRGVPLYVQLLIVYFVLPEFLGINLPMFLASCTALIMCSCAYVSQIVRAGINTINVGQWEAAQVLSYTTFQTLYYIIIPQMFRNILPSLIGELDQLLKSTSIMSTIGMLELTRVGMNIVSTNMNPLTVYFSIAGIYLLISSLLNLVGAILEERLNT